MSDKEDQEYEAAKAAAEKEDLDAIFEKLIPLDKLSFEERVAAFMGRVQVLELGLKGMLVRDYGYEEEKVENLSLGLVVGELRKNNENEGFLSSLDDVVEYRNHVAHEILAVDAMVRSIAGDDARGLSEKGLRHALFAVQQAIHIHDKYLPAALALPMLKAEDDQE